MQISVKGSNKQLRNQIADAAAWYGQRLIKGRVFNNISVTINLHKKLYEQEGHYGAVWIMNESDRLKPRSFEMELDIVRHNPFLAMAHEFIHVKQMVTGKMKDLLNTNGTDLGTKWYSTVFDRALVNAHDRGHGSWLLPWEAEAYRRQAALHKAYKKHEKSLTR